jgi:hypothetical protein
MRKKVVYTLMLVLLLSLPLQTVLAQNDAGDIDGALNWLETQLQEDGGFSNGFAPESDVGATADAVLAFVVAGRDPGSILTSSGVSPLDFLRNWTNSDVDSGPGAAAKVALAVIAAGFDANTFAERDLIGLIRDGFDSESGLFGFGPFDSGLAILALVASESEIPAGAVESLIATRLEDGSYAFTYDPTLTTGDSNTTALVVQALLASGIDEEVGASIEYFRNTQNDDGGWTYQKPSEFGEDTDSNSTALAIQALGAAGEDLSNWGDPMNVLDALQESSGAFAFSSTFTGDNMLATLQAIPTLAGADYVHPVPSTDAESNINQTVIIGVLVLIVLVLGSVIIVNRRSTENKPE